MLNSIHEACCLIANALASVDRRPTRRPLCDRAGIVRIKAEAISAAAILRKSKLTPPTLFSPPFGATSVLAWLEEFLATDDKQIKDLTARSACAARLSLNSGYIQRP